MHAGQKKLRTITARRDFLAASSGSKWITPHFIMLALKRAEDHPVHDISRVGYTVTKKMGNAVTRNRIKRRLRHAIAQISPDLVRAGYDYVLISREKALTCEFSALVTDMEFAFSRIHANKKPSKSKAT